MPTTEEHKRLAEVHDSTSGWRRWGPYVSDRAWATVREDYSPDGEAWTFLPHDQARSKAYRWGEDAIAGFCDRYQLIVFAPAFWNGRDAILKERLFGLSGPEGNHGEDVKEYYYYLDATPTHSYLRFLYKYPQGQYPYERLVAENARRGVRDPEFELLDTGLFDQDRYFDIEVEYAKVNEEDIAIRVRATNRGPDPAPLHLIPHLWFRNTWSWGTETTPAPKITRRAVRPTRTRRLVTDDSMVETLATVPDRLPDRPPDAVRPAGRQGDVHRQRVQPRPRPHPPLPARRLPLLQGRLSPPDRQPRGSDQPGAGRQQGGDPLPPRRDPPRRDRDAPLSVLRHLLSWPTPSPRSARPSTAAAPRRTPITPRSTPTKPTRTSGASSGKRWPA